MISIEFAFPPNNGTFLAGKPIMIRGKATWPTGTPVDIDGLPFKTLLLTSHESRFNGEFFSRWVEVLDVEISAVVLADSSTARWEHEVTPFDGMARYMLNVLAFDADGNQVASSDPLLIRSVE
jgi:hypothetical protein